MPFMEAKGLLAGPIYRGLEPFLLKSLFQDSTLKKVWWIAYYRQLWGKNDPPDHRWVFRGRPGAIGLR